MWLLLLVALAHAAAAMEFAGDPTVQKTLGPACFPVWDHISVTAQLKVAHYEAHAKQWVLQETHVTAQLQQQPKSACTVVARPGLYRVVTVALASASAEQNAPLLPVLVTGPVHYITTTAAPTAATLATTTTATAAVVDETEAAECGCPCMTGAGCTTVNKCFGVFCGHDGTCDAGTGTCVCPDEYTGPRCQLPACSHHGFYNPVSEQCVCRTGWGGYSCQVCAAPPRIGFQYICLPVVRATHNNAVAYLLMAVGADDARDFLSGVKRADPQLPYHAIIPNAIGFDGQRYNCECVSEADAAWSLRRRITPAELDAYNVTIVECINAANATEQQTSDMVQLWTTCVSFQEQGLLTNGWWIGCIILGILALVELVAIIMGCVVWSSQARAWRDASSKYV